MPLTQTSAAGDGEAMGLPAGRSASEELLMPAQNSGHREPEALGEPGQTGRIWPAWLSPVVPGVRRTDTRADAEARLQTSVFTGGEEPSYS